MRQREDEMRRRGFEPKWHSLLNPVLKKGVRGSPVRCSRGVELIGALPDGKLMSYSSLVLDAAADIDAIAPLLSLEAQDSFNTWFNSRTGKLCCLPAGIETRWPSGTRQLQCAKDSSGHWRLGFGHWDIVDALECEHVRNSMQNPSVPSDVSSNHAELTRPVGVQVGSNTMKEDDGAALVGLSGVRSPHRDPRCPSASALACGPSHPRSLAQLVPSGPTPVSPQGGRLPSDSMPEVVSSSSKYVARSDLVSLSSLSKEIHEQDLDLTRPEEAGPAEFHNSKDALAYDMKNATSSNSNDNLNFIVTTAWPSRGQDVPGGASRSSGGEGDMPHVFRTDHGGNLRRGGIRHP